MMLCMYWVLTSLLWLGCGAETSKAEVQLQDSGTPDSVQDTGASQDTTTDDEPTDCDVPEGFDWANWGQPFFRTWCSGCHAASAPDRHGAPEWLVFDTEAQAYERRVIIRSSVLELGSMPLGGGLPEQEAASLDLYLRCVFGS